MHRGQSKQSESVAALDGQNLAPQALEAFPDQVFRKIEIFPFAVVLKRYLPHARCAEPELVMWVRKQRGYSL